MNELVKTEFVSEFWTFYISAIALGGIIACAVLLKLNSIKPSAGAVQLHGHTWDENLQEYNHPLPRWWSYLFYITVVFGLVYLALYPGLGSFKGILGWSSVGQYYKERDAANAQFAPIFDKYQKMPVAAVAADPEAKAMGERMFLTYCAMCHGSDAKGAKGFPNLRDKDWLYGGTAQAIETTILDGRNGVMPGGMVQGGQVKDVANYVLSLSGGKHDAALAAKGKPVFETVCAACHGPDGKGNQQIGAPNLTDGIWLYGSSEKTIEETITKGRNNRMPAFKEFLGPEKVHILAAYVYGLGGAMEAAPAPAPAAAAPAASGPMAKLYFDSGKAELPGDAATALQSVVDFAKANAAAKVAISGFHDETGNPAANEELAKERAKAVREALKAAGVAEDRVEMRKPQVTGGGADNKEARRVEVSVI